MSSSSHHSNGNPVKPPFNEVGGILAINFKLLYAALMGAVAWWIWPSDPKWWGFGLISIFLGASSTALVLQTIRSGIKLHAAKRRWTALQALGNAPKNARLAKKHDLQNKGMN